MHLLVICKAAKELCSLSGLLLDWLEGVKGVGVPASGVVDLQVHVTSVVNVMIVHAQCKQLV